MTKKILTLDEHPELAEAIRDLLDGATIYGVDVKEVTVEENLATVRANLSVYGSRSAWWIEGTLRLNLKERPNVTKDKLVREGLSQIAAGRSDLSEILDKLKALEVKVRALGTEKAAAYDSANPGREGELSSLAAMLREIVKGEDND